MGVTVPGVWNLREENESELRNDTSRLHVKTIMEKGFILH